MTSAQQKEFLEYVKTAIDIETDLETQKQIVEQCCNIYQMRKSVLKLQPYPQEPVTEMAGYSVPWFMICLGVFLFCIVGLGMGGLIIGGALGGFFVLCGIKMLIDAKKVNDEGTRRYNAYLQRVKSIRKANREMEKSYKSIVCECDASIQKIVAAAQPNIDETERLLRKLYNRGIVYQKYCTLPALTSIYEYFITGRCDELTGPHGAYNLYEDELRKDTVISQLNTVIENLEQIKQNQYMLYQQVKAIQENTAAITYELQQIKGYTIQIAQLSALNAYYAALNERNTRITMYYHL